MTYVVFAAMLTGDEKAAYCHPDRGLSRKRHFREFRTRARPQVANVCALIIRAFIKSNSCNSPGHIRSKLET